MSGLHIAAVLAFAALLLWAAGEDIHRLTISNWVSLAIVGLYPIYVLSSPVPVAWPWAVAVAALTLAVGFALFAFRMIGGGDVKLLSATALWAGPVIFPSFIFLTAIAGGVVGLAILLLRRRRMSPAAANGTTSSPAPAVMPYGVAIAIGGLMVALTLVKGTIL
jgi:prepilin peptidase CpaA